MSDSTHDISVIDQVCILCVLNEPNECLLCVTPSHCGTGEGLFQLLKNASETRKIVLTDCIANSTDGAANVSGIYNGLQAKTKENVPNHVYIRCDAHALNSSLVFVLSGGEAGNFLQGFVQAYERLEGYDC